MKIVAILACHNEERFIDACLSNLIKQGLNVYLIDNDSTDNTLKIAEKHLGNGLIDIESFPRFGYFDWEAILLRKEKLSSILDADWFMHVDADEIRLPPPYYNNLYKAILDADQQGCNAINFHEFVFVPTREKPNHDHPYFIQTMRWYYYFMPNLYHRLNTWKKNDSNVGLAKSGGHKVNFKGIKIFPESFYMRHYLFLSFDHIVNKYVNRQYSPTELNRGWHRARNMLKPQNIKLQSQTDLKYHVSDQKLDTSHPYKKHPIFQTSKE